MSTISIENPKGTIRQGKSKAGTVWRVKMHHDYGYIRGTVGMDGDQLDCFIGPKPDATHAYIVHQHKSDLWEGHDEDKVMLGFDSLFDAQSAYLQNYSDPRFLGPITAMPMKAFKNRCLKHKGAMPKPSRLAKLIARRSP
jgi:hypothetical protein